MKITCSLRALPRVIRARSSAVACSPDAQKVCAITKVGTVLNCQRISSKINCAAAKLKPSSFFLLTAKHTFGLFSSKTLKQCFITEAFEASQRCDDSFKVQVVKLDPSWRDLGWLCFDVDWSFQTRRSVMGNQLSGIAPSQILSVEHYFSDLSDIEFDCR